MFLEPQQQPRHTSLNQRLKFRNISGGKKLGYRSSSASMQIMGSSAKAGFGRRDEVVVPCILVELQGAGKEAMKVLGVFDMYFMRRNANNWP